MFFYQRAKAPYKVDKSAKLVDVYCTSQYNSSANLVTTNKSDPEKNLQRTTSTGRKHQGGAYGIRGFHYQHVYGTLLAVKSYCGDSDLERIVPEGSDDYEIQTSDGLILISAKTKDEKLPPRTVREDAKSLKKTWNRDTRDGLSVTEYQLVLNRGHKSYDLVEGKKSIARTALQDHRDIRKNKIKFDKSYIVVEADPLARAVEIIGKKLNVLPVIANIVCSVLTHRIIDKAISNRHHLIETKEGLSKADILKIINDVLLVCKRKKVEKLIREGLLKECDFTPAPASHGFFLNVDVRLGHVTSGQIIDQPKVVESAKERLKASRRCFIIGPSGTGKSAVMWQIVENTRKKVCWYEVTTKSMFDTEALTQFLRAASHQQRIGLVIDDVGAGKSEVLDQLVRNTKGYENVWILGSLRVEYLSLSQSIREASTFHYHPDEDLAEALFDKLVDLDLVENPRWKDAWIKSDGLLMEYMYLLTKGKSLNEVVFEQVRSRLFGQATDSPLREDELYILSAVMPVVLFGGRVNFKSLQTRFTNEYSKIAVVDSHPNVHRTTEPTAPNFRFARALRRLTGEFIRRDSDNDEVFGLHDLRTKATVEAMIALGCLARTDLAVTAIKHANVNTIEHVSFRIIFEGLMNEDEIVSTIKSMPFDNGRTIDWWTKIGRGIHRGRLQQEVNKWYITKYLISEFPPRLAIPVVFSPPFENESVDIEHSTDDVPSDIKSSAEALSHALFEKVDSIGLPHLIIFNIINSLRLNGTKLRPNQIHEALSALVGTKLGDTYIQQLKKLNLNFGRFPILDVATILDAALAISSEVQEAWIDLYEKSSPERPLVSRLVDETVFAHPIIVTEGDNGVSVAANFSDCVLIANDQQIETIMIDSEDNDLGQNRHPQKAVTPHEEVKEDNEIPDELEPNGEIDHPQFVKDYWGQIRALVPKAKNFSSKIIDADGNISPTHPPIHVKNDTCTTAMQNFSNAVSRAIERNYLAGDWVSFLTKEEKLLSSLYELCVKLLNRLTMGTNRYDNTSEQFIELTERVADLAPPKREWRKKTDSLYESSSIESIIGLIGASVIGKLYRLPSGSEQLVSETDLALSDLKSIRAEPWELVSHKPERLLDNIEEFLKSIRFISLEANRIGANPLKLPMNIQLKGQNNAFSLLSRQIQNTFCSYLGGRNQQITEAVGTLFPSAEVTQSEMIPNTQFYTRHVITLPLTSSSEWTKWFTCASEIVRGIVDIFKENEDYSIVPIVNGKYGVGYRWENQLEVMRTSQTNRTGQSSLDTNRFLSPNRILFDDVNYSPAMPELTIYDEFTKLCGANNFIFGMHDGTRKLEKEFEVRDKAVAALRRSYFRFRPFAERIGNEALYRFCDLVEQVLAGQHILKLDQQKIDCQLFVAGLAEVIRQSSVQ